MHVSIIYCIKYCNNFFQIGPIFVIHMFKFLYKKVCECTFTHIHRLTCNLQFNTHTRMCMQVYYYYEIRMNVMIIIMKCFSFTWFLRGPSLICLLSLKTIIIGSNLRSWIPSQLRSGGMPRVRILANLLDCTSCIIVEKVQFRTIKRPDFLETKPCSVSMIQCTVSSLEWVRCLAEKCTTCLRF